MARLRMILSLCLVGLLSATARAQTNKPEPVISHIPAGTMGFVVVPNVQNLSAQTGKFLEDIGLGQVLSHPDPNDASKTVKSSLLDLIRGPLMLGKGLNPNGGLAVTMLDLKKFNIDIVDLMGGGDSGNAKPKLPFVIFVPGKDVKSVLGAYNPQPSGKYMTVTLPPGPMFVGQIGSYLMISPNDKALDMVAAATKKAAADLPAEQLKAVQRSQVAICVNGKVAAPTLMEVLQLAQAKMSQQAGPMAPLMSTYFRIYRELLTQLDMITITGRYATGGVVFEEMLTFQPDSPYGKAIADEKLSSSVDFKALPDYSHVLAMTASATNSTKNLEIGTDLINSLLNSDPLSSMPEDLKASIKKSYQDLMDQVTGIEFVGGGAPEGSGVFGLATVIKCKDSAKMCKNLADDAGIIQGLIKHFGKDDPDANSVTVKYVKNLDKVGDLSADAIVIDSPELVNMPEDARNEMKKSLGEDKIRIRIAAPDKNTVVLAFGGSDAFFTEAVKTAAANNGKIGTNPEALAAMKHLPVQKKAIILFNAGNLFDAVMAGAKAMTPNGNVPPPPFQITCKTPIAIGIGKTGKSAHVVVFLPTKLVQEVTDAVKKMFFGMFQGGGGQAAPPPPMGGSDF